MGIAGYPIHTLALGAWVGWPTANPSADLSPSPFPLAHPPRSPARPAPAGSGHHPNSVILSAGAHSLIVSAGVEGPRCGPPLDTVRTFSTTTHNTLAQKPHTASTIKEPSGPSTPRLADFASRSAQDDNSEA